MIVSLQWIRDVPLPPVRNGKSLGKGRSEIIPRFKCLSCRYFRHLGHFRAKDGEELPRRARGTSLTLCLKSFGPWTLGCIFPSFDRGFPFQQTVLRARVEAASGYDAVPARAHSGFGACGILRPPGGDDLDGGQHFSYEDHAVV